MSRAPAGIYYILGSVVLERSCFFGIRNLLNVYLKNGLGLEAHVAKSQVHLFVGLAYGFPLLGAMVSDSFLGKYRSILMLYAVYVLGAVMLSVFSANGVISEYGAYPLWSYYLPCLLISLGAGGMMPSVVSHFGDQFEDSRSLERFFSVLYLGMSLGSLFGQYLTPYLKQYTVCFGTECYFAAYGASAILLAVGFVVFLLGSRCYVKVPAPRVFLPWQVVCLTWYAIRRYFGASEMERRAKGQVLRFAEDRYPLDLVRETQLIWRVTVMFVPLVFAWMLYDQSTTEWQNQYERMDKDFFGLVHIPTEASTNINYVLVIAMVPFVSHVIYPRLGYIKDTTKLLAGFLFIILAFVASVGLDLAIDYNQGFVLNGAWQLPQWLLLSIGEAILSPIVYQFSYTQVGPKLKSCAQSISLLSVALGNYSIVVMEFVLKDIQTPAVRQSIYILIAISALVALHLLTKFWYIPKADEGSKLDFLANDFLPIEKPHPVNV